MRELGIDIETYSSEDLAECGVYRYAEAPDFEVLLFAYSADGGAVCCVDIASGESLPGDVLDALTDPSVLKTAFNAQFERVCLSRWLGVHLDPEQWQCTMVMAARMGLPLSLGQCAEVLGLAEGKMTEGRQLIRIFSKPGKNGRRTKETDPDKWGTFKKYNIRDVEVEQEVLAKVRRLPVTDFERRLYVADQRINDRGVLIDRKLVYNASRFDEAYKSELLAEAKMLTGMENPNSPSQIKEFIRKRTNLPVSTLNKSSIDDLTDRMRFWPDIVRLLEIRRQLGKTSNKKYDAMLSCVCEDGRIRGLLQYYGAARTGRWAGRLVQVQNLPQNHLSDIDTARNIVKSGDLDEFELYYSDVPSTLSELIRTSFVAKVGTTLHVCDFSAIEARVIAWLAGEQWVLDVFRNGGDIYCETASKMFGVTVEKHGQNAGLRQKGKIATLALGYGGGVSALEAMGGKRLGLSELEEADIVKRWRKSNPGIVRLWKTVEDAAFDAINTGQTMTINRGIEISCVGKKKKMLLITLPSGRVMCYPRAEVLIKDQWVDITNNYPEDGYPHWGKAKNFPDDARAAGRLKYEIKYEGVNQTTKKWGEVRTYGGKLTENIVQAIARDILGVVIVRAEQAGLPVVFHVHDEVVVEAEPCQTLAMVENLFSKPVSWCRDLPLKGAGYSTDYYLKD